jgi:hypothetical protein
VHAVTEIIFLVEEAEEGGYTARAVSHSIFTEADTLDELRGNIREAVECHFDEGQAPTSMRLESQRLESRAWLKAQEESFAKAWDNDEDAAYDEDPGSYSRRES